MHPVVRAACDQLALSPSKLGDCWLRTQKDVARCKEELANSSRARQLDVIVLGSLARGEATDNSDFDFLIVAHGLPDSPDETRRLLLDVEEARERLGYEEHGRSGLFGRVVAAADLTERIGLEHDTNATHTLRILILHESRSVYQPELHRRLVRAILGRYLVDYQDAPKCGVARFLFNDMVRYWRTIAVDYQAKRWGEWGKGDKWGLRYLKLRISRKLAFAGTLASMLLPAATEQFCTIEYLESQFELPPLARLAQLYNRLEGASQRALGTALTIADEFLTLLADSEMRTEVQAVTDPRIQPESSLFGRWRKRGDELQEALECVFFESTLLGKHTKRYLSF